MPNEMQLLISEISKQIGSTSISARYIEEDNAWSINTMPGSTNGPFRITDSTDQSFEDIVNEAIKHFENEDDTNEA